MQRIFKTEAIVLRKKNLLGKDTIVTLFTEELGKALTIAKGIRSITSRRLPHTETGNLITAFIYKKDSRLYLQETKLISHFSIIKKELMKLESRYLIFYILDRLLPENVQEKTIYTDTKKFFIKLTLRQSINDIKKLSTAYLNILLKHLGYLKEDKPLEDLTAIIEEIIHEKIPRYII